MAAATALGEVSSSEEALQPRFERVSQSRFTVMQTPVRASWCIGGHASHHSIYVFRDEIDESTNARRQMLMSRKDSMYQLNVFRVVFLEDLNKQSSVNVWLNMELSDTAQPAASKAEAAHDHTAIDDRIA
jgi:hypothetical protein